MEKEFLKNVLYIKKFIILLCLVDLDREVYSFLFLTR